MTRKGSWVQVPHGPPLNPRSQLVSSRIGSEDPECSNGVEGQSMAGKRLNGEGSVYQRSSDGRWVGAVTVGFNDSGRPIRKTVSEWRPLRGRLHFGGSTNSAPLPSAVVIYRPSWFEGYEYDKPKREAKSRSGRTGPREGHLRHVAKDQFGWGSPSRPPPQRPWLRLRPSGGSWLPSRKVSWRLQVSFVRGDRLRQSRSEVRVGRCQLGGKRFTLASHWNGRTRRAYCGHRYRRTT
jgi:hypothetical protein